MKGVREQVLRLMKTGGPMAEIARQVGVSRERVRQIIRETDRVYRSRAQIRLGKRKCLGCGKMFQLRNRKQKYCSLQCVGLGEKTKKP
ncbi:MAG: helix-turn-helix domain-containing protein [candidate division WOR-3 bacterium]|nr:helix-turn-helix domain-containing protein [candidate division WOR-3 bacterium]MDH5683373.1 helix-turn-helix domain-containing protein [candidate division WOR-3 bacterium]